MVTLELPYPPSINHYWRHVGSKTLISRAGRQYREDIQHAVRQQLGACEPIAAPVELILLITAPDRRRRDLDNLLKPSLDALTHAGVWQDDSQIIRIDARWSGEPAKPGRMLAVVVN